MALLVSKVRVAGRAENGPVKGRAAVVGGRRLTDSVCRKGENRKVAGHAIDEESIGRQCDRRLNRSCQQALEINLKAYRGGP